MSSSLSCLVTGTDTEIGKTLVSCALLLHWQKQGFSTLGLKPVAAGAEEINGEWHNEDVDALAACSSVPLPLPARTPYLLRTPAAPHIAAALEGTRIEPQVILSHIAQARPHAQAVVVEGVGGFRVPLNDQADTADLAVSLNWPVVMVVGMRLGCINQALLTYEAILARGLRVVGWVANSGLHDMAYPEDNVRALTQRLNAPLLGVIPRIAGPSPSERAHVAAQHLSSDTLNQAFA